MIRTVVESPNAALRRELGLGPNLAGEWLRLQQRPFPVRLHRVENPGHEGRLLAVKIGLGAVLVRWDNGWLEVLPYEEVTL